MTTPEQLFARARAADSARPLVTFYDDSTGERAELSAASLGNWIAKTHFLFADELNLGVGGRAYIALPLHWQTLVVYFGAWSAGLEVVTDPDGADAAFVTAAGVDAASAANELYALALAPWGQGFSAAPPPGSIDFVAAVRPQADAWASVRSPGHPDDPALDGRSRAAVVSAATRRAEELGLAEGARLLVGERVGGEVDGRTGGERAGGERAGGEVDVATLLAPLVVGGTLVLLRNGPATSDDRRIGQEKITNVALVR